MSDRTASAASDERRADVPSGRGDRPGATGVQLARFLVVGSASVAVDLAVYALLTALSPLAWWLAKGLSYAAGVAVGYVGNKFWTFQSRRRGVAEPALYALLYAFTLLLNMVCNEAALAALGSGEKLPAFLLATAASTITNFLGMKFVAFRHGRSPARRGSARVDAPRPHIRPWDAERPDSCSPAERGNK